MVLICKTAFTEEDLYNEAYFTKYFNNLSLSDFQKWAIKSIIDGDNVLITAHTGSGKTLPAEFAIQHLISKGKKVIYTTPIKALSNQKLFDFRRKFPTISFGILTFIILTLEPASSKTSNALSGKNLSVIYLSENLTHASIAESVYFTP